MMSLKERAEFWKKELGYYFDGKMYIVIKCGVTILIQGCIVSLNDKTVRLSDGEGNEHSCYLWDIREVSY